MTSGFGVRNSVPLLRRFVVGGAPERCTSASYLRYVPGIGTKAGSYPLSAQRICVHMHIYIACMFYVPIGCIHWFDLETYGLSSRLLVRVQQIAEHHRRYEHTLRSHRLVTCWHPQQQHIVADNKWRPSFNSCFFSSFFRKKSRASISSRTPLQGRERSRETFVRSAGQLLIFITIVRVFYCAVLCTEPRLLLIAVLCAHQPSQPSYAICANYKEKSFLRKTRPGTRYGCSSGTGYTCRMVGPV